MRRVESVEPPRGAGVRPNVLRNVAGPVSGPGKRRREAAATETGSARGGLSGPSFAGEFPQTSSRMGTDARDFRVPSGGPFVKGLILAQNERWRRGLGMQVERVQQCTSGGRVSKATATNPEDGYSRGKLRVIPSDARASASTLRQRIRPPRDGPSWY